MTRAVFAALLLAVAAAGTPPPPAGTPPPPAGTPAPPAGPLVEEHTLPQARIRKDAGGATEASGEEPDGDDDGVGDVAPFMIVVEHVDGWRCSGSLLSLRTALTSAWCARGRGPAPARELWALAAAAAASGTAAPAARSHAARRIARLALATGADAELADGGDVGAGSWRGGAMDLAIVELEEPFGQAAGTRPILMSTTGDECAPAPEGAQCHVSRAVAAAGTHRARLRIVGAALVAPAACAAAADHWAGVRDRALCLVGPELCESDWGGGVVCGGKLCGVLSRSVRGGRAGRGVPGGDGGGGVDACGDTHAAQSVARWRRFLHCAHTLRACGRSRDCADLCVERRLIEEPETETEPPTTAPPWPRVDRPPAAFSAAVAAAIAPIAAPRRDRPDVLADTPEPPDTSDTPDQPDTSDTADLPSNTTSTSAIPGPTRSSGVPSRTAAAERTEPAADPTPASARPAFEFEPNRADFKAAPTRSTRVYLKAGEYGDNAAEYGGEEGAPLPAAATTPDPPTRTPAASLAADAAAAPAGNVPPAAEGRSAPAQRALVDSGSSRPRLMTLLILLPLQYLFTAINKIF